MRHLVLMFAAGVASLVTLPGCASRTAPELTQEEVELESELAGFEELLLAHEDAIADCMVAAGFEYVAGLPSDWVLERATQLDLAKGGSGNVDIEVPEDPNHAYVASLSEAEQEAYELAYWGASGTGVSVDGCYFSTYETVWGMDPLDGADPALVNAQEAHERTATDPRVLAALDDFTLCMGQSGYAVSEPTDIFRLVGEQESQMDPEEHYAYERAALETYDVCRVPYEQTFNEVRNVWETLLLDD